MMSPVIGTDKLLTISGFRGISSNYSYLSYDDILDNVENNLLYCVIIPNTNLAPSTSRKYPCILS